MRLEARDVTVHYGRARHPALDGVSITVREGSLLGVLGPNGSGKSTLMRALLGSVPLTRGQVLIGERPLDAWGRRELARSVGAVTQTEVVTFPLTVREFVAMGRYPHLGPFRDPGSVDQEAVQESLERCDVASLASRDVGTLSGGEFQRVRVARALAQEPTTLILDEPTASLDVRHEMEILQLLRRSADEGMTVVVITHHLEAAARFADRMLLLSEGRVAAEGSVEQVLQDDILTGVYGWPLAVRPDPLTGCLRVTPMT
jgi:iron complex transport system ATP-binding protein